jgi:hypothetical protein
MNVSRLRTALFAGVADLTWWQEAMRLVVAEPAAIIRMFPQAGRHCGRDRPLSEPGWSAQDAARVLLLDAIPLSGPGLAALLETLYQHGDANEKRAVLRALPLLTLAGEAVDLLRDAIRSNDIRLLAAAVGPYAAHLPDHDWRHAVLKCVFTGVSLDRVHDLGRRTDAELVRMLDALARERAAAGRPMPADALLLLTGRED